MSFYIFGFSLKIFKSFGEGLIIKEERRKVYLLEVIWLIVKASGHEQGERLGEEEGCTESKRGKTDCSRRCTV